MIISITLCDDLLLSLLLDDFLGFGRGGYVIIILLALFEYVQQHLHDFLCHEGHGPGEHVQEVRQYVWVRRVIELLNVQRVLFELNYCPFVIIHVTIVRCREYGYHHGELLASVPFMHLVAIELSFVGS